MHGWLFFGQPIPMIVKPFIQSQWFHLCFNYIIEGGVAWNFYFDCNISDKKIPNKFNLLIWLEPIHLTPQPNTKIQALDSTSQYACKSPKTIMLLPRTSVKLQFRLSSACLYEQPFIEGSTLRRCYKSVGLTKFCPGQLHYVLQGRGDSFSLVPSLWDDIKGVRWD